MEILFVLIVLVIVGVIVGCIAHYAYNATQPTVTRRAKVVGKRTVTNQNNTTNYLCAFEFEDGQRAEYSVGGSHALIFEGDHGELDTRGVLFWEFRPRKPDVPQPARFGISEGMPMEVETRHSQPPVKVRCRQCQGLNDETARFCNQCGSAI